MFMKNYEILYIFCNTSLPFGKSKNSIRIMQLDSKNKIVIEKYNLNSIKE